VEPDPRFVQANERTLLAYVRTALALVAGGVALSQLAELRAWERVLVAVPAMLLGMVVAVGGYRRWRSVDEALRAGRPLPALAARRLVGVVVGLGALALVVVVVDALVG
jgi:putative membrane protein